MKHKNNTKEHREMLSKYEIGDRVVIKNVAWPETNKDRINWIGHTGTVYSKTKYRCDLKIKLDDGRTWYAYVQNVDKIIA